MGLIQDIRNFFLVKRILRNIKENEQKQSGEDPNNYYDREDTSRPRRRQRDR